MILQVIDSPALWFFACVAAAVVVIVFLRYLRD